MKQIILREKDYRTIKYFNPEDAPVIVRPCFKCGIICTGYLSDMEYPHNQDKVWFCCEGCTGDAGRDHEFYTPIKCIDVSVVCTFEVEDNVVVKENG